jgi:hypothetical protein
LGSNECSVDDKIGSVEYFLYIPSLYILTRSSRKSLKMAVVIVVVVVVVVVVLLRSVRLQFALEMETSSRSVPVEDAQNCDVVVIF